MNIDNCSNPWKDIASYEIADASCFKGREKAIKKFLDIIDNGAFSVLYSASGIGKTSFVQAGIEPAMMRENYVPVHVRFINDSIYKTKKECIEGEIINIIEDQLTKRGYSWTANFEKWPLDSNDDEKGDSLQSICENSLWWRFYTFKVTKGESETNYRPLFLFDQFEETFIKANKYHNSQFLNTFFQIFEELSTPVLPIRIEKIMNILFERGIRYKVKSIREFKVVFCLRKEYLSDFDNWTNDQFQISELLQNRMLLYPLSRSQAERVIAQQPLIDIDGNIVPGEYTGTLIHVKDLILDKLDARHQNEIEPFLLSLLCSRLFERAKRNKQNFIEPDDLNKYDIRTILRDFYIKKVDLIFKDQQSDLECFENCIIDENGFRNRIKSTNFPGIKFDTLYKDKLNDEHIIRVEKYGDDVDYVELVHDMLAIIINERKNNRNKIYEARRMNQRRVQDDLNVLTIRGRRLLDNTLDFGSFINQSPFNESPFFEDSLVFAGDFILDFNFRYHHHESINNHFSRFLYEISGRQDNYTYFEFRNQKNKSVKSIDGINKFRIRVTETKGEQGNDKGTKNEFGDAIFSRQSIFFLNKEEEPFYIKGFCGVNTYFDDRKREVCREYLDEYENRVCNIDGYSMVRRIYDEVGNIRSTRYYNSQYEPCPHRNGNFGYNSTFDSIGRESTRFFVDKNGEKTKIASNIWGRLFTYYGDSNYIKREFNVDKTGNNCRDKDGFCGVEFKYDELSRIICETYLDENETPMIGKDGYSITTTEYKRLENNKIEVTESYCGTNGENVLHKDGFYKVRFTYEDDIRLVKYEYLDTYGKLMNSKKSTFSTILISWNDNYQIQKCMISDKQGGICSSKWFLMDERNQFIKQSGELKGTGEKKRDDDGGYGQQFIRDAKSLMPIGFLNININGQVSPADNGILEHRIERKDGHMSQQLFYDKLGNPKEDEKGAYGYYYEYDEFGNCIEEGVLDSGGNPYENKYGYAYTKFTWNENRKLILSKTYNIQGMPFYDESGDYATKYEYLDSPSMTRIISLTENDVPHNNKLGYCTEVKTFDYLNRIILQQFFDEQDKYVLFPDNTLSSEIETIYYDGDDGGKVEIQRNLNKDGNLILYNGFAYRETAYDIVGRITEIKQFDENNNLLSDESGDYITRFEYEDNNSMRILSFDKDGTLHLNNDGFAISIRTIDGLGREIKRVFLDCQNLPTTNNDGSWGYNIIYSDDPSVEVIVELGPDSNPLSAVRRIRDEKGRVIYEQYLDSKLDTVCRDGIFAQSYTYDDMLNLRITKRLDENNEPYNNENGWTYEYIYFDVDGDKRPIKIQWYKKDKTPFKDENGDCGIGIDYLDDNKRKQISLDENGMPHTNIHNYSYRIIEEDTKGRTIFEMWYNENNIPALNNMEDSGVAFEYDDEARIRTKIYLNQEGMPHINKSGRSMIRRRSDINDKYIEEMWLDEKGLPLADKKNGCYGIGTFYFSDNMEIRMNLDNSERLAEDKDGIAFSKIWRDSFGRITKKMNYDIFSNPAYDLSNYCGEQFIYTDDPNTELRVYLDSEGNPCKTKVGYMREVIISTDNGTKHRLFDENWRSVSIISVVLKALFLFLFKKKHRDLPKAHDMAVFHVTLDGQLKENKIEGDFMLIQYNEWKIGFPMEILNQEIENSRETGKEMVFIRLKMNEDKLSLGEYYHMYFIKGLLGAHIESILIPNEVYQKAMQIVNYNKEN